MITILYTIQLIWCIDLFPDLVKISLLYKMPNGPFRFLKMLWFAFWAIYFLLYISFNLWLKAGPWHGISWYMNMNTDHIKMNKHINGTHLSWRPALVKIIIWSQKTVSIWPSMMRTQAGNFGKHSIKKL